MIHVSMDGLDVLRARLGEMGRQVEFAAAVALTKTSRAVADAMPDAMERELDRPTQFTKRGLYVTPARRGNLMAVVGFKDLQARYMALQIAGGTRAAGPHGIKLPGNITLNAFGNVPRGTIERLKAAAQGGDLGKAIARRLGVSNRRKGAAPIELYYGKPAGKGWENAPIGIWRRVPGSPGKLVPVIVFPQRAVRYRPRFQFARDARQVVERVWPAMWAGAFEQAMRTAR
jgi:hypothetical protein